MRTFISIDISEKIKKEILKIQEKLPEFAGKKTEFDNLHLTLKFLGEMTEGKIEVIKEKLKEIKLKNFETKINSIGVFSEDFIKIVWLHLTNCEELQKEIDEKLKDIFDKEERFMSHLTIARVKKIHDQKRFLQELKKIKIPEINFIVKKFNLKKSVLTSDGPVYEDLEVCNLE